MCVCVGGGNELTSEINLELKNSHKSIYLMEWVLERDKNNISKFLFFGISINYHIFEM